jgi:hypothetical protein
METHKGWSVLKDFSALKLIETDLRESRKKDIAEAILLLRNMKLM